MTEDAVNPENGELIEALARRLVDCINARAAEMTPDDIPHIMPLNPPAAKVVARECLRQMEWARRECDRIAACHWGGPASPECGDSNACCVEAVRKNMASEPFTLAPPAWQP